ncbi:MAG: CRISPR system precrRNA processing endoribonuclease RAMP protein Cas6 [Myxococcales bacterium]|nr:CRISPR system precrRNA processing endoribonuclease RAMP protein Cas6 [Myxococcales bacterium]
MSAESDLLRWRRTRLLDLGRARVEPRITPNLGGLENLGVQVLWFELMPLGRVSLPPFIGSTLRGAIGHALRAHALAAYDATFEGCPAYALSPPPLRTAPLRPGETLRFGVTLFGEGALHAQAWIDAVAAAADGGLGVERHRFRLHGVDAACSARSGMPGAVRLLGVSGGPAPQQVRMHAVTPLWLVSGRAKALVPDPDAQRVLRGVLRRAAEVVPRHCGGAMVDVARWEAAIGRVHGQGRWAVWEAQRWSNRQQAKTPMAGVLGCLDLAGDVEAVWPLLQAAELLHVGRHTTFGLGQLVVEARGPCVRSRAG